MSNYAEFWEHFGLTPLTIWDLPGDEFFKMAIDVETMQAQKRNQEAREAAKINGY